ncbi:MAG: hypothetical protein HY344_01370 [Candidatus Levybacteria bacterium]|nr:hypothetical protein [Candidatus Levybacteria bacterium]
MYLLLIIQVVCFLIFLYNLYYFSHEDFVIVRRDIQMERIFNIAFLAGFMFLFFSRLFYVIFNPTPKFLSIIGFIAYPYFPGFSLIGGMAATALFLGLYFRAKKLPIGKMLDLFTISFLGVLPLGFLAIFAKDLGKTDLIFNILLASSFLLVVVFRKIIFKFAEIGEIKDGSCTLIFLAIFSLIYFLSKLFVNLGNFSFFETENIVLFITIFSSIVLLINHEIMDKFLEKK